MNRMKLAVGAAMVGAASACAQASAATAAEGTLTNFRVELIQQMPGAGTPWVTFGGGSGAFVDVDHDGGTQPAGGLHQSSQSDAPFQPGPLAGDDGLGGGSASLEGDVFGEGGTAKVSGYTTDGADRSDASGLMYFGGPFSGNSTFTLSPYTTIVISAYADLLASDTTSGQGDYAEASALFRMGGTTSEGTQQVVASLGAFAGAGIGAGQFDHEAGLLSISFTNPDADAVTGSFKGFFSADDFEQAAVSSVPEPEVSSAMLAGLALLAIAARRRRA